MLSVSKDERVIMKNLLRTLLACVGMFYAVCGRSEPATKSNLLLPAPAPGVTLWWALSSAAKIRPDQPAPTTPDSAIRLNCARNEREAVQLVVRSSRQIEDFHLHGAALVGPNGATIPASQIDLLQVKYLDITQATDRASTPGLWPDPLLPITGPLELKPDFNHAFWLRVFVPTNAAAGLYRGTVTVTAKDLKAVVPLELRVYDFALPDRMTCTTAFGFSPGNVFRYHGLQTEEQKRAVLEKYWADLAAHHISPYNPAPLDRIQEKWPDIHPPKTVWDKWTGLCIVSNETHSGQGALLINDDKVNENVTVSYDPLIKIPAKDLRLKCWYRTPVPGHRFLVTLNHFDARKQWLPGRNNDLTLRGDGRWQQLDELITHFPPGAEYVRFNARATTWTDRGEELGLVWLDDISLTDAGTGEELAPGGDFERRPRTEPVVPLAQLRVQLDFTAWDRGMAALDRYHFNAFQVHIPGIGGGTFHAISPPNLLGFGEDTPEYPALFDSYCRQLEAHLAARGWLDRAFIYWFDEPSTDQYPFVMNGFAKLKRSAPRIARMLTEQVEPTLIGGPDIWCSISDNYDHVRAEARRQYGEKFWWYVCTGPKAPYAGLFVDHPAPEMRIWLWQTFQRNIEGVLVWETTYWTSSAAYPDAKHPQNPYTDPMSWTSGYSTPDGDRRPWGNGDGRFIYPPPAAADGNPSTPILDGPVDSIRWEQLRDGLEDYEYLSILRRRLAERRAVLPAETYQRLARLLEVPENISQSLTQFASDGVPIEQQRDRVARAIEELQ